VSWTATGRCFYCTNYLNRAGIHVYAGIRHHYANGDTRDTDRNFHVPCFATFQRVGRPLNPRTAYEVLWDEIVNPRRAPGGTPPPDGADEVRR
jgi:hypothetical protein